MSKKTFQKIKEREKKVKEKLERRRNAIRKKAKAEREDRLSQREAQKIDNRVNGRTIVNRSPEDQHALLQRNLEILKALDDQQKFMEQERLKNPPQQVIEQHERARGIKQTADVQFIPNLQPNDSFGGDNKTLLVEPETTGVDRKLSINAESNFTPNLTVENIQESSSELLDDDSIDSAASRLAEKLELLSKSRKMGSKK